MLWLAVQKSLCPQGVRNAGVGRSDSPPRVRSASAGHTQASVTDGLAEGACRHLEVGTAVFSAWRYAAKLVANGPIGCPPRSRAAASTRTNRHRICRKFLDRGRRRTLRYRDRSVGRCRRAARGRSTAWWKSPSVPKVPDPTLSGAVGSFKMPKVVTPARSYFVRSAHICCVGHARHGSAQNLPPGEHGQAPRLARAKTGLRNLYEVKTLVNHVEYRPAITARRLCRRD